MDTTQTEASLTETEQQIARIRAALTAGDIGAAQARIAAAIDALRELQQGLSGEPAELDRRPLWGLERSARAMGGR